MRRCDPRASKPRPWVPVLVFLLCVCQPILDVIAYWNRELSLPSDWTSVLRLALLLGGFLAAFLVTERKRAFIIFSAVILAFLAGHALACLGTEEGYINWVEDLTDQARTLVLPITAVTMMSFLRAEPRAFEALLKALVCNLVLILFVMLLSTLTGTDPHTYPTKSVGIRGWFIWTSPQSAILSILCPLVIAWALRRWPDRTLPVLLTTLVSFGMLFAYGTRLGYFTILGVGLGLAVCVFPGGKRRRLQAGAILLCALLFLALYPVSPMTVNRTALLENEAIKQERVNAAVAALQRDKTDAEPDGADPEAIRAAYRYNLQGMIDRFGLEQVAERYGHTLDASLICNDRIMKTYFCGMLIDEVSAASPLSRFFGVELERTRVNDTEVYDFYADDWVRGTENYDPENDVIGVLTLNGIVGFALLAAFLLWFGLRALWAVWTDRSRFTPLFAAFLGAYGIALIYAVNTASTLRRNNASVYFAWVLAGLWYLSVCPRSPVGAHSAHPREADPEGGLHD